MKSVFSETREAYFSQYLTFHGLTIICISAIIYGYLLVNYLDVIFAYLIGMVSFLPNFLINIGAFLLFGLLSAILDLLIIFIMSKAFEFLRFKNRRILN